MTNKLLQVASLVDTSFRMDDGRYGENAGSEAHSGQARSSKLHDERISRVASHLRCMYICSYTLTGISSLSMRLHGSVVLNIHQ